METIVKAICTYVIDMIDQISAINKFCKEFETFMKEYLHEHPDEIDNVYAVIKCFNPSFSEIIEGEKIFNYRKQILAVFIMNNEKMNNNQKIDFEAIVRKRLQSGEDEILYRFSLGPEEKHN